MKPFEKKFGENKSKKIESLPEIRTSEQIQHKNLATRTFEDVSSLPIEAQRESLFRLFVVDKMLDSFEDDLSEAGISLETIDQIVAPCEKISFDVIYRAMAFPHDVRSRLFEKIKNQLESGELAPQDVLMYLAGTAKKHNFSIGFHMSAAQIRPGKGGWGINGKEIDHRDDDLPMAYYARSYATLYRRKIQNFLYIVRCADTDRNDGNWWRSPALSIIQQIPLSQLQNAMLTLEKQLNERIKQAA